MYFLEIIAVGVLFISLIKLFLSIWELHEKIRLLYKLRDDDLNTITALDQKRSRNFECFLDLKQKVDALQKEITALYKRQEDAYDTPKRKRRRMQAHTNHNH